MLSVAFTEVLVLAIGYNASDGYEWPSLTEGMCAASAHKLASVSSAGSRI